jgi:hypothetical protein
MTQDVQTELAAAIAELLARRPGGARFVVEINEGLRSSGAGSADLEAALMGLERRGAVLIRDHACADPHLEGADLRIAALVDQKNT